MAHFALMIAAMSWLHARNLSLGRDKISRRKFTRQPSRIKNSARVPSSRSFERDNGSSLGTGSFSSRGRHIKCIASGKTPAPRSLLSLMSGTTTAPSSTKSSMAP